MFRLYADKNNLTVRERECVTSGSVNVYQARFEFSEDWAGLERAAVFRCSGVAVSVLLDVSGECAVPWEVLKKPGFRLEAGVYGTRGGTVVLPTVWAGLVESILPGAAPGETARPPTPELWEQLLAQKADRMGYTEAGELGLYSGGKLLNSVPVSGGGEGGTIDHRCLTGRDAPGQHPIGAIPGLEEALASIPVPMTADQLRKILMNGGT